jgi:hypothetical protein
MTVLIQTDLIVIVCKHCGVLYGMPNELWNSFGSTRFCPNGHMPTYGNSAADRIRSAEDREKQQCTRAETAERSNAALRGAIRRMKGSE